MFNRLTDELLRSDPEVQLRQFKRTKNFLVAIDTDGCITDNMNGKQMLIFHPHFMEFYNLWGIESFFREVAEYYNLFSIDRGCNRFVAISLTLKALSSRPDVKKILKLEKIFLPDFLLVDSFINFSKSSKIGLGNPALEKYIELNPANFSLYKLLAWSEAVNRTFPYISAKIPPFDNVKENLEAVSKFADIIVVSKTPYVDLVNYWENYGIAGYVKAIAGQEMGSKSYHINMVKKAGSYNDNHVLMIGDGNGDLRAVKENNGLFYPIKPGSEQEDWYSFPDAFNNFISEKYQADYENSLLEKFKFSLLTEPQWGKPGYNHENAYREKQEIRKNLYASLNPAGRLLIY